MQLLTAVGANFNHILNVAIAILLGFVQFEDVKPDLSYKSLNCDFAANNCSWSNVNVTDNADGWMYGLAEGPLDVGLWAGHTGIVDRPIGNFAILRPRGHAQPDRLVSNQISCQKGKGKFQMKYWSTTDVRVKVCVVNDSSTDVFCTADLERPSRRQRTPNAAIDIDAPSDGPFHIAIVTNEKQGFAVVDDINYTYTSCDDDTDETTRVTPVKNKAAQTNTSLPTLPPPPSAPKTSAPPPPEPLRSFRRGKPVATPSALRCNFESRLGCRWAPQGKWYRVANKHSEKPSKAAKVGASRLASLSSDLIMCQKGAAKFKVSWYASKGTGLRICAITKAGRSPKLCRDVESLQPHGPVSLHFGQPILEPFVWRITPLWRAEIDEEDYFIVDDIGYEAELCTSFRELTKLRNGATSTTTTTTTATKGTKRTNPKKSDSTKVEKTTVFKGDSSVILPFLPETEDTDLLAEGGEEEEEEKEKETTKSSSKTRSATGEKNTGIILPYLPERDEGINFTLPRTTTRRTTYTNLCRLMNCQFERNFCSYKTSPNLGDAEWTRRFQPFGSPLSRDSDIVPGLKTGHYVGAFLHPAANTAVFESMRVEHREDNLLLFRYYRAAQGVTLKICFENRANKGSWSADSVRACPVAIEQHNTAHARFWNKASVVVPRGTTKIYFVAEQTKPNSYGAIALDNLRIFHCERSFEL